MKPSLICICAVVLVSSVNCQMYPRVESLVNMINNSPEDPNNPEETEKDFWMDTLGIVLQAYNIFEEDSSEDVPKTVWRVEEDTSSETDNAELESRRASFLNSLKKTTRRFFPTTRRTLRTTVTEDDDDTDNVDYPDFTTRRSARTTMKNLPASTPASRGEAWWVSEWTLISIAIISFILPVTLLILARVALRGRPKEFNMMTAPGMMYVGNSGQPMFYQQPQQVQMTQQQPFQVFYSPQPQQPAVFKPNPIQLTDKQPEIAQVELEVRKDDKPKLKNSEK